MRKRIAILAALSVAALTTACAEQKPLSRSELLESTVAAIRSNCPSSTWPLDHKECVDKMLASAGFPKPEHPFGGEVNINISDIKPGDTEVNYMCSVSSSTWVSCDGLEKDSPEEFKRSACQLEEMKDREKAEEREQSSLAAGDFESADFYRNLRNKKSEC